MRIAAIEARQSRTHKEGGGRDVTEPCGPAWRSQEAERGATPAHDDRGVTGTETMCWGDGCDRGDTHPGSQPFSYLPPDCEHDLTRISAPAGSSSMPTDRSRRADPGLTVPPSGLPCFWSC